MQHVARTGRRGRRAPVELEIRLLDWGPKGSAIADVDGRRVAVDRGIPGELVIAEVPRPAGNRRGVVTVVREPSEHRVEPACPHYRAGCGGCQWQHIDYGAQVRFKRAMVNSSMAAAGVRARVGVTHAMAIPWRYRRTAAIALGWEAGFRPRAGRGIVEIHDCPISHPFIGRLTHHLNELLVERRIPPYHGKVWLDCTVAGRDSDPGLQVVIQGIEGLTLEAHPELPEVAGVIAQVEGVRSVAYRHRSGEVRSLHGELTDIIEVAGRPMWLPAGSFSQTNLELLRTLIDDVRGVAQERSLRHAADLYGGIGTFGLALAPFVDRMTLVELDPSAAEAALRTAALWGIDNVDSVARHAELVLPELGNLDLIVVDPPRSGLEQRVLDGLVQTAVPLLIYVSCSPSSLARDLAFLEQHGYRVDTLKMFDFYPQTFHVECLATLSRCV